MLYCIVNVCMTSREAQCHSREVELFGAQYLYFSPAKVKPSTTHVHVSLMHKYTFTHTYKVLIGLLTKTITLSYPISL